MTEDNQANGSADRILAAAARLFAARGYHAVSTREIAAAVGLNISTVNYHVGGKRDLYRAVFRRMHARESDVITALVTRASDDVVADRPALKRLLLQLVDATVDLLLENPENARLWVWRWLDRPGEMLDLDAQFSVPLFQAIHDLLQRGQRAGTIRAEGLDLRMLLMSFTWMLYGYFTRGALDPADPHRDPFNPPHVQAFRAFLHDYVIRMLDLRVWGQSAFSR
ncbi:MAG: TetR/AcrR family transcriptional regulator [Phycisphaerae bacterium]|nr:TetR/AcrR family transcriptional regulator [Phycisphaerae bacterium]